jgi:hypothetical protein
MKASKHLGCSFRLKVKMWKPVAVHADVTEDSDARVHECTLRHFDAFVLAMNNTTDNNILIRTTTHLGQEQLTHVLTQYGRKIMICTSPFLDHG